MPKYNVDLNPRQQAGLDHVVALRNAEIEERNAAVRTHNENLKEGDAPQVEEELFTAATYFQTIASSWAESYAAAAETEARNNRFEKLKNADPALLAQIDALP